VREIVIPELTKEVNEDKNFAHLRQVYNSLILATWYKKKIKDSILSQVYADKNKTAGVQYNSTVIPAKAGIQFKNDVEGLYQEYLKAFKKGVYNYIKEEQDPATQEMIPRKYFSGGMNFAMNATSLGIDKAMKTTSIMPENSNDDQAVVTVKITATPNNNSLVNKTTAAKTKIGRPKTERRMAFDRWINDLKPGSQITDTQAVIAKRYGIDQRTVHEAFAEKKITKFGRKPKTFRQIS
jgi:hypothetical protein